MTAPYHYKPTSLQSQIRPQCSPFFPLFVFGGFHDQLSLTSASLFEKKIDPLLSPPLLGSVIVACHRGKQRNSSPSPVNRKNIKKILAGLNRPAATAGGRTTLTNRRSATAK
jgi:hypothetical protein